VLSIGVVAYNNPEEILEFAEHLRALPLPEHEVRIWDNSEDGRVLAALQGHPELGVCGGAQRNLGFGEGHNRLFEESDGEHYLISNADVRYTEDCVPRLLGHCAENSDAGLVAPRLLNEDGSLQLSCRTFYTPWLAAVRRPPLSFCYRDEHPLIRRHLMAEADHTQILEVDWVMGAVVLVRRATLGRAHLFDPRYFLYFEDVDLCRHFHAIGRRVLYCGDAVATHAHHRSSAKRLFGRTSRWHIQSCLKYFWKHR
jgi:GT2 family glycosyltransferase